MKRASDETLMAYADGALPDAERRAVEELLEHDAEARELVETFRRTSALVRGAFDGPMSEKPPAHLVERILAAAPAKPDPSHATASGEKTSQVVPLPARSRRRASLPDWLPLPLAASIMLAVGLTTGFLTSRGLAPDAGTDIALGPLAAGTSIARALDTTTSGSSIGRIAVVASFRDRRGRICREFEAVADRPGDAVPETAAVACRDGQGQWTVEGAVRIAAARPAGSGFEPSGVRESDALQGLLDMLGAGAALTPQEERALIGQGWR